MSKRWIVFFLLFLSWSFFKIDAEEGYALYDSKADSYKKIAEASSLNEARNLYRELSDDYDNLVLQDGDRVIMMEYGIVEFRVDDACELTLNYEDREGDIKGINGCYGIDAAYLSTSDDMSEVKFMISGDIGMISVDDVILHPYETLDVSISYYTRRGDDIYHDIKAQLEEDYVYSSLAFGPSPSYLNSDMRYYSYDGHYFYESFYDLIDDLRLGAHDRAINNSEPYYNYYMYLPHRTLTRYTFNEIDHYFKETLVFNKHLDTYIDFNYDYANDDVNRSQYVDNIDAFFENEYRYGANAMMMLSLSIYESSYGKSYNAYTQNNLFGHAAYDTAEEIANGRYDSIARSVYSHARYYISSRFADHNSSVYSGSFFGDKASGMNVNYSLDPYWGENLASDYYSLDRSLGFKDYNAYALGIGDDDEVIYIYRDAGLDDIVYTLEDIAPYSFVLLEEGDDYYKVQVDMSADQDMHFYDYETDIGYIAKDTVDHILNPSKIKEFTYHTVTFDLDNGETISYKIADGKTPMISDPYKEGYEFIGLDKDLLANYDDTEYKAIYREIVRIEVIGDIKKEVALHGLISLEGASLRVTYRDLDSESGTYVETQEVIELTTDMISNYDLETEGKQTVIVDYCGVITSFEIEVKSELYEDILYLDKTIPEIIEKLTNNEKVSIEEVIKIKEMVLDTDYVLDNTAIVLLDQVLLKEYRQYMLFNINGTRELAISGMALALDVEDSYKDTLWPDTYHLSSSIASLKDESYLTKISKGYGFEEITSFSINFKKNEIPIRSEGPFIIEIRAADLDTHKVYTVYYVDDDGDVIKCRTTQSKDAIQFTTMSDGNFMVLALDSSNDYTLENPQIFNLTVDNDDLDLNATLYVAFWGVFFILSITIAFVYYKVKKEKTRWIWSVYRKSWRMPASPQGAKLKN